MFGMGMSEILIICAVALLVFGPDQLPDMVKKIAKGMKEVRRASDDLKRSINLDDDERPQWRRPIERTPLVEPPQTATSTVKTASSEPPPAIPGSLVADGASHDAAFAHHDGPVIAAVASAVAQGTPLDDAPAALGEEATDPQKPSSKEASSSSSSPELSAEVAAALREVK